MTLTINESLIEQAALQWLVGLGYETAFGPEISPWGSGRSGSRSGTWC